MAATIRLQPRDAAHDARWLNVTAWQGGGSVVDPLKQIGPGVYRTTKPIPVYGNWKVTVRLQKGAAVMGLPVYFPNDPAIPVGADTGAGRTSTAPSCATRRTCSVSRRAACRAS